MRKCPEGLLFAPEGVTSPALAQEYRCELEARHEGWHIDGNTKWAAY